MANADQKTFATGSRDLRIDFLRGLALYMIFVDHVLGDPLSMLTYRILGFSDAAEIFVFLSGVACGTAYSRTFARGGLSGLVWATAKRAGRIYFYYVLSSAATILAVTAAMRQNSSLTDYFGIASFQRNVVGTLADLAAAVLRDFCVVRHIHACCRSGFLHCR